jgi:hypothetical protein
VGLALLLVLAVTGGTIAAVTGALGGGTEQASSTDPTGAPDSQASPEPGSSAGSTASAEPEATDAETPAPTSTPSATPTCDQNLVTVSAATDKAVYGPEENPMLTLKVSNGGKLPCQVNIGTSQMEFLITSGSDRIFSSRDCQASSEDLVKTIEPGKSETANFPWPRNRSVEGCREVSTKPGGGGAYYIFTAKLGAKTSQKAVFRLN